MPSPATLDFAKLLAPIAGDKPTGTDLRADQSPMSLYFAIKGARNQARAAERMLANEDDGEKSDTPPPDWKPIHVNAVKALSEKSKDLEVTAFLIEALVRLQGFAGLRDGFRLARELVEKYWDTIFPLPDEEGLETRLGGLIGLNGADSEGTLMAPITRVPITDASSVGKLTMAHYMEALAVGKISDPKVKQKRVDSGAKTLEIFQKAVSEGTPGFFLNLVQDLTECQQEFGKLCAALDAKCAGQAPPSSNIRASLEAVLDAVKNVAKAKLDLAEASQPPKEAPKPAAPAGAPPGTAAPAAGAPAAAAAPPGETLDVIRTREDAFKSILKVADFFRRTEPHTIVSFALEQVVRWGRMPLPELLTELISEEAARKNLFKQVGIKGDGPPAKPEPPKK